MLVTLSSVRGAPGTTSWAMLLALAWPHTHERILVEADGVGGMLGPRYGLPLEPGATALLASTRSGRFSADLRLDSVASLVRPPMGTETGVWVSPGLLASDDALVAWRSLARQAALAMNGDDRLWLVDCGRPWPGSPTEGLIASAALDIVVTDASFASLVALRARPVGGGQRRAVLIVGSPDYPLDELRAFTGVSMLVTVPWFDDLADLVGDLTSPRRRPRRSAAWRRALEVAHELASVAAAPTAVPVGAAVSAPAPGAAPAPGVAPAPGPAPAPAPTSAVVAPAYPPPPASVSAPVVGPPPAATPARTDQPSRPEPEWMPPDAGWTPSGGGSRR